MPPLENALKIMNSLCFEYIQGGILSVWMKVLCLVIYSGFPSDAFGFFIGNDQNVKIEPSILIRHKIDACTKYARSNKVS